MNSTKLKASGGRAIVISSEEEYVNKDLMESLQPTEDIWKRPILQYKPKDKALYLMYKEDSIDMPSLLVDDVGVTCDQAKVERTDASTPLNTEDKDGKDNRRVATLSSPSENDGHSNIEESLGDQFADFIALVGLMPHERRPRNFHELRFLWRWAQEKHLNDVGKWHVQNIQEDESTDENINHDRSDTIRSVPLEDPFNVVDPQPIVLNFLK